MRPDILDHFKKFKSLGFIVPVILILSLSLFYFFNLDARRRIKTDALYWQAQSLWVKNLSSRLNSEAEIADLLQKMARQLEMLRLRAGQHIDMMQLASDYARRMNIHIADIKAYPEQRLEDGGRTFLLRMEADAGYINLLRYLEVLQQVAPALVTVDSLKIKKDKMNQDRLKFNLELRFFIPHYEKT
jgi:hypothetical protein